MRPWSSVGTDAEWYWHACSNGEDGTEPGAQISTAGHFSSWPPPVSHRKTNSFWLETMKTQWQTNAKKAEESFKGPRWIKLVMWDYHFSFPSPQWVYFWVPREPPVSCSSVLFQMDLIFDSLPWQTQQSLLRHRLCVCWFLRGKLWFRIWGLRIADFVSSLLMKLLIWVPMVFLLHGHLPTQHD